MVTSGRDGVGHLPHQIRDRELLGQQLHLARLDLRQVEDIVDDRQQMLARLVDLLQVGAGVHRHLLVGHLLKQLAVADDGIQRSAELMADVGQEDALDPAGLDRLFVGHGEFGVGRSQLFLDPLPFTDLLEEDVIGFGQLGLPRGDRSHLAHASRKQEPIRKASSAMTQPACSTQRQGSIAATP